MRQLLFTNSGGYDRGECMKSTEQYSFQENTWTDLAEMRTPRGRCSIAEYDGKIYACGGSDGHREIKMVEVYDGQDDRWSFETDCPAAKASPGNKILPNSSCELPV